MKLFKMKKLATKMMTRIQFPLIMWSMESSHPLWLKYQEETNEALQNEEIGHKDDDQNPVSTDNVKIEILDDEESDLISNSEVDQMSSLLDYKNEEVRFIESQLENHKQKYFELQTFTRSLILAVKSDDKEQQQALLSDLPPELEEMDFNHTSPEPDDTSFSLSSLSEKNASDSL
ncbi:hypothetical protein HGM15179_021121 [Zosterops borbonicus]|uniref:Highly divergent homeobox n=1 Tax=Zosterops borbonicus TaxID=364589 RepID=A0A8K1D904_9PASS|nr:hypothetical protein HGM15179_021121 [Zosterops borbonicus]